MRPHPAWALLLGLQVSCGSPEPTPWTWALPDGFPTPFVPDANPMTVEKVELGRLLFFDPLLSRDRNQSCGSCHEVARAFTDGRALSMGSTGELTRRSSMSLVNVAYNATLNWADARLTLLEDQARGPLFGTDPVELGMAGLEGELVARLEGEARYQTAFAAAFPEAVDAITLEQVLDALASFQRSLVGGSSAYDRYLAGQTDALDASARRGLELFFGEQLECFHCHGGFNFSQSSRHDGSTFIETPFHNTGLYNLDGRGAYPEGNRGIYEQTGAPADMGRFRAPTLRNIALTAPYMHDGSAATLDDVLDHYSRGGREIESGPNAGDGRASFLKSGFVSGFRMTPQEREDIKAFLRALSDEVFLQSPRIQDPYP